MMRFAVNTIRRSHAIIIIISPSKSFSRNPLLCVLDNSTRRKRGRGFATSTTTTTTPSLDPLEERYVDAMRHLGGMLPAAITQGKGGSTRKPPLPPEKVLAAATQKAEEICKEVTSAEALLFLADVMYSGLASDQVKLTVAADPKKAAELWRIAGERGSDEGVYQYANCLLQGIGVRENRQQAEVLLSSLVEKGHPLAHYTLAVLLQGGGGGGGRGRSGSSRKGVGTSKEEGAVMEEVYHLLKAAIKAGVVPAIHNLANLLAEGSSKVPLDNESAMKLYAVGAALGDPWSTYTLATWMCSGRGGDEDWEKGFELHLKAADSFGMPQAQYNTATHYFSGRGVKQDMAKAASYFEKAAQAGMTQAMVNLGNMYHEELVSSTDPVDKAKYWYQRGADLGNDPAKECLAKLIEEEKDAKGKEGDLPELQQEKQ